MKQLPAFVLGLGVALGSFSSARADDGALSIQVLDEHRQPVQTVVMVSTPQAGVFNQTTDAHGNATFLSIPDGSVTVSALNKRGCSDTVGLRVFAQQHRSVVLHVEKGQTHCSMRRLSDTVNTGTVQDVYNVH